LAMSRRLAALEGEPWQPIETAPKDGTKVMLWSAEFDSSRNGVMVGSFVDYADYWQPFIPVRWTHWRSLPLPPADALARLPQETK